MKTNKLWLKISDNHKLYKFLVSILLGWLGAAINLFPVNLIVPPFTASLVFGLVFPMLVSIIWGWKYGLLALVPGLGGQTMWFLWVPHNGWAPFVAIPLYNLWILWHGWCSAEKRRRIFKNIYLAEFPFRIFAILILYTLFRWSFRFNPSPWAPEMTDTDPSLKFINFIAVKMAVEAVMILLLSDVLMNFSMVRKLFLLKNRKNLHTGYIVSSSILLGLILWLVSGFADSTFSEAKLDFLTRNPSYSFAESVILNVPFFEIFTRFMFLFVCISAGLIISKLVLKYNERSEDLKDSEERYRTLIESMSEGIAIIDKNDKIQYANHSLLVSIGVSSDNIKDHSINYFLDDHNRKILNNNKELIIEGKNYPFEIEWKSIDEKGFLFILSPRALYDDKGEYNGYFAVLRDITQERKTEKEKTRLENQLRQAQKMEAIGRLTGGVAHDFNNILTTIIGYSELIAFQNPDNSPLLKRIESIRSAGVRASKLTRQLLAFSRNQVIELAPVNINNLIRDLINMLRRLIGEDISLEFYSHSDIAVVMADQNQIEQVIMNLVVNAGDAMPDGGKLIIETDVVFADNDSRILPDSLDAGNYIVLSVVDTGEGIPVEILDNIFDPFFTTKDKEKGTGLGLSTVYGIVKQHKGDLLVSSKEGAGSCFKIFLPAARAEVMTFAEQEEEIMPGGSEKLLIVDDYPEIGKYMTALLLPLGYNLTSVSGADEALEIINNGEKDFDLLISDVMMPGTNGKELSDKLKEIIPGLKIIFMSGYTSDFISEKGFLKPGINFISKPLIPSVIAKKIRNVLDSDK